MASLKRRFIYIIIWIKELFRFCPYRKANIDKNQLFLTCGHRGSPVNEPENTIPSFAASTWHPGKASSLIARFTRESMRARVSLLIPSSSGSIYPSLLRIGSSSPSRSCRKVSTETGSLPAAGASPWC